MNREDADGTVAWGARALELAERLDEVEIRVHALNTIGHDAAARPAIAPGARSSSAASRWRAEAGLEERRRPGLRPPRLGGAAQPRRTRSPTRRWPPGSTTAPSRDLDLWRLYLQGFQSRSQLDQGRWTEAAETASVVLGDARTSSIPRILAGVVARARARAPRRSAARRTRSTTALRSRGALRASCSASRRWPPRAPRSPGCAAIATASAQATEAALRAGGRARRRGVVGELALWRRRAGISDEIAADASPSPTRLAARRRLGGGGRAVGGDRAPVRGGAGAGRRRRRRPAPRAGPAARARRRAGGGDRRPAPARARARAGCARGPRPHDAREPAEPDAARGRGARRWSSRGCATGRSPSGSSSRPRRSTTTSARSCASSASTRAARRARRPGGSGSLPTTTERLHDRPVGGDQSH